MNPVMVPVDAQLMARRKVEERLLRWVGFELMGQRYALRIEQVREVLSHAEIEPVPGAGAEVMGVTNLRGRIVTVVDLRICLNLRPNHDGSSCIVVVEHGGEPVALRVDRIQELHVVAESAIKPAPNVTRSGSHRAVCGVISRGSTIITLLDVASLLSDDAFAG